MQHIPIRADWLATRTESPFDPGQAIVDAHHHLYDRPGLRYLFDDFLADLASGHDVRATVFVQARSMLRRDGPDAMKAVGETEFANGVAAMSASGSYGSTRVCAGIVGHADLRLADAVRPVLEAHLQAAGSRFKGIRQTAAWDADATLLNPSYPTTEDMLATPDFRAGYRHLGRLGLSFDAWVFFPQLPRVAELARAFPDTPVMLNHLGGIVRTGPYAWREREVFERWEAGMRELADCENVMVKLSGLGMGLCGFGFELGDRAPASEALAAAWRPWVERCIEIMGPARCVAGSNFPVDKGSHGYGVGWNALQRILQGASARDRDDIFRRNATRFYRLEACPSGLDEGGERAAVDREHGAIDELGRVAAKEPYCVDDVLRLADAPGR